MKTQRIWKCLLILVMALLVFPAVASADASKLRISQIVQKGNDVDLYVSLLDGSDHPLTDSVSADQFTVTIGEGEAIPVASAVSLSSSEEGVSYVFVIDVSKSVTEDEMQQVRESLTSFVSGLSANDYMQIITAGTQVTSLCEPTQDQSVLTNAVQQIARTDNYTYLYKAISAALETQRKNIDTLPERVVLVVVTDGMDDSDGATDENQVLTDIAETRVPLYVIGVQGKDSTASLSSVGTIARQSGGLIFSYNDMTISEAMSNIKSIQNWTWKLTVQPPESTYGTQNLSWSVMYSPGSYSLSSSSYVYSLSLEGVVFETETETEEPTEAPTEEPTEEPTEAPTEAPTEEPTEAPTEVQTEAETSLPGEILGFLQENLIICIAAALILIALIIILISILLLRKNKDFETESYEGTSYEETLADISHGGFDPGVDSEETVDEIDVYDDERTIDEAPGGGIRLQFEITFDGHTEMVERVLDGQLVLGRGPECDVDVVLGSTAQERKTISRHHAFIVDCPDGLYVKDNEKNKTYLNGMEISGESVLRDEDVLQMGKATVRIKILNY